MAKKATMLLVELYLCTYQVNFISTNDNGTSIQIRCANVETLTGTTEKIECRPGKLQFCYISLKIENVISHLKFLQEQIRIKIRFT